MTRVTAAECTRASAGASSGSRPEPEQPMEPGVEAVPPIRHCAGRACQGRQNRPDGRTLGVGELVGFHGSPFGVKATPAQSHEQAVLLRPPGPLALRKRRGDGVKKCGAYLTQGGEALKSPKNLCNPMLGTGALRRRPEGTLA